MSLNFPDIDPIAISIGPLNIYWYALSYVVGILFATYYAKKLAIKFNSNITVLQIDNVVTYIILGIVIGGRLGYVLFYDPMRFYQEPIEILKTYTGGMSFHGATIGVILAMIFFCYRNNINFLSLTDLFSPAIPFGLFFGRLANFINAELYGRVTDVPWAITFPYTDGLPRHPSQIYEALLEGLVLFFILNYFVYKRNSLNYRGFTSGLFLIFYAIFRIFIETFREPDIQLGFIVGNNITMGQILSIPMLITGLYFIYQGIKNNNHHKQIVNGGD